MGRKPAEEGLALAKGQIAHEWKKKRNSKNPCTFHGKLRLNSANGRGEREEEDGHDPGEKSQEKEPAEGRTVLERGGEGWKGGGESEL